MTLNFFHILSDFSVIGTETPIDDDAQLILGKKLIAWNCTDQDHSNAAAVELRLERLQGSLEIS